MPGTLGSLLALPLIYSLSGLNMTTYGLFVAVFSLVSVWISQRAEEIFAEHDSQKIVIDEVVGMLVTFMWIPLTISTAVGGFILFRFFDIVKIPPICQMQKLPKGWGVVADDFVAGVFANIILQVALSGWYMYAQ